MKKLKQFFILFFSHAQAVPLAKYFECHSWTLLLIQLIQKKLSDNEVNAHILHLIPEFSSSQINIYLALKDLGIFLNSNWKKFPITGSAKGLGRGVCVKRKFPAAIDLLPD